jgi:Tol biopolymer transport system component
MQNRTRAAALALVAALALTGCPNHPSIVGCADSTVCTLAAGGQCLPAPVGFDVCAYPDTACPSGFSWSPQAGDLAGECVATDVDAGTDAPLPACAPLIAFDRNDGIYVIGPDGSGLDTVITSGAEKAPVWSPDGTRLLFLRSANNETDIYVVNRDGTGLDNLTEGAAGDDNYPSWSPDGTRILFTTERNYSGSGSDVYVMNADGSNPRMMIEKAYGGSWKPDGTRIAIASYRTGRFQVWLVDPDGSNQTNITMSAGSDADPVWSPDGTRLAFTSLRGGAGGTQLYVMNADGTQQRNLTPSLAGAAWPTWSPDGMSIAFDGPEDVFTVATAGGSPLNITPASPGTDRTASWSPDGDRLAFISARDGNDEVYRVNADGSGPTRLTFSEFFAEGGATWSPCRP